jgi:hypothetical protein
LSAGSAPNDLPDIIRSSIRQACSITPLRNSRNQAPEHVRIRVRATFESDANKRQFKET